MSKKKATASGAFTKILNSYDGDHHYANHHKGKTRWDGDPARGLFVTPAMEDRKRRRHGR